MSVSVPVGMLLTVLVIYSFMSPRNSARLKETQNVETTWLVSPKPPRCFIENKSQFDGRNELRGSKIRFAVDQGHTQIFFTETGFTYRMDQLKVGREPNADPQKAEENKYYFEEEKKVKVESAFIHVSFENAGSVVQLRAVKPVDHHFSYSVREGKELKNLNFINGYEELVYHDLYPGIDVVFSFHPKEGIKYFIKAAPGAELSNFKMNYTGQETLQIDGNGNLQIGTHFGNITDHAPVSYYTQNPNDTIFSQFSLKENSLSFSLGSYDKNI